MIALGLTALCEEKACFGSPRRFNAHGRKSLLQLILKYFTSDAKGRVRIDSGPRNCGIAACSEEVTKLRVLDKFLPTELYMRKLDSFVQKRVAQ